VSPQSQTHAQSACKSVSRDTTRRSRPAVARATTDLKSMIARRIVLLLLLHTAPAEMAKANGKTNGDGKTAKAKGDGKTKRTSSAMRCSTFVSWMLRVGLKEHPERYPGLTVNSTAAEIQHRLHQTMPASRCPDASGSFTTPALPTFTSQLGLNASQLSSYREMRKRHAAELVTKQFKSLSKDQRLKRRRELAAVTLREMQGFLNASQLALFRNRSAIIRRPPAMHVAASLSRTHSHTHRHR